MAKQAPRQWRESGLILGIRLIRVGENLPERISVIHDFFSAALAAFEFAHVAAAERGLLDLVHLAAARGAGLVGHDCFTSWKLRYYEFELLERACVMVRFYFAVVNSENCGKQRKIQGLQRMPERVLRLHLSWCHCNTPMDVTLNHSYLGLVTVVEGSCVPPA